MDLPFIEQTFISAKTPLKEASAVILGCPYDGSASFRPGARFGPSAIRRASWGIETYSPYLKKDLGQFLIHDMGDLELPLGEKKISLDLIRKAVRKILSGNKFPILLGGDHLITLPVVEELVKNYPAASNCSHRCSHRLKRRVSGRIRFPQYSDEEGGGSFR